MTRAGRKTDAATTLLMVLLILTAAKLLLERLLALMLPHDLHQNTRLLLSMAQEALLIGLPALLMRRGRSARTGTMRLSIGLLLCAAVLGLAMRALATPLTQLWGNFLSAPERQIAAAASAGVGVGRGVSLHPVGKVEQCQLLSQRKAVGFNKVSHSHSPFSTNFSRSAPVETNWIS